MIELFGMSVRHIWCLACYLAVNHWPFSCRNRVAWPMYLWLTGWAGVEMYRRGEL